MYIYTVHYNSLSLEQDNKTDFSQVCPIASIDSITNAKEIFVCALRRETIYAQKGASSSTLQNNFNPIIELEEASSILDSASKTRQCNKTTAVRGGT